MPMDAYTEIPNHLLNVNCCVIYSHRHRWELPVNYPIFTVVMVISHYIDRILGIIVTPDFLYNIQDNKKILSG